MNYVGYEVISRSKRSLWVGGSLFKWETVFLTALRTRHKFYARGNERFWDNGFRSALQMIRTRHSVGGTIRKVLITAIFQGPQEAFVSSSALPKYVSYEHGARVRNFGSTTRLSPVTLPVSHHRYFGKYYWHFGASPGTSWRRYIRFSSVRKCGARGDEYETFARNDTRNGGRVTCLFCSVNDAKEEVPLTIAGTGRNFRTKPEVACALREDRPKTTSRCPFYGRAVIGVGKNGTIFDRTFPGHYRSLVPSLLYYGEREISPLRCERSRNGRAFRLTRRALRSRALRGNTVVGGFSRFRRFRTRQ